MFSLLLAAGRIYRVPAIARLREENVRRDFFERGQFEAIRRHLPAYAQPVVTIASIIGWRMQSEILPLQWWKVDFRAGTVTAGPNRAQCGAGVIGLPRGRRPALCGSPLGFGVGANESGGARG